MADKYSTDRQNDARTFGSDAVPHTPADSDLPINVKAVVFAGDGTISFKNAAGTARTGYPVKDGVPLPFVPARITAMTGATACWLVQ
ncbi:MAG: spike base protein, RCAP_Rcc01079 family [Sphingobium sp.]|jgi:hypothetical protein